MNGLAERIHHPSAETFPVSGMAWELYEADLAGRYVQPVSDEERAVAQLGDRVVSAVIDCRATESVAEAYDFLTDTITGMRGTAMTIRQDLETRRNITDPDALAAHPEYQHAVRLEQQSNTLFQLRFGIDAENDVAAGIENFRRQRGIDYDFKRIEPPVQTETPQRTSLNAMALLEKAGLRDTVLTARSDMVIKSDLMDDLLGALASANLSEADMTSEGLQELAEAEVGRLIAPEVAEDVNPVQELTIEVGGHHFTTIQTLPRRHARRLLHVNPATLIGNEKQAEALGHVFGHREQAVEFTRDVVESVHLLLDSAWQVLAGHGGELPDDNPYKRDLMWWIHRGKKGQLRERVEELAAILPS